MIVKFWKYHQKYVNLTFHFFLIVILTKCSFFKEHLGKKFNLKRRKSAYSAHRYEHLKVQPLKLRELLNKTSIEVDKRVHENDHVMATDKEMKKSHKRLKKYVEIILNNEREIMRIEERKKLQQQVIGLNEDKSNLTVDLAELQKNFDELKEKNDLQKKIFNEERNKLQQELTSMEISRANISEDLADSKKRYDEFSEKMKTIYKQFERSF